jgi:hypothetical protein
MDKVQKLSPESYTPPSEPFRIVHSFECLSKRICFRFINSVHNISEVKSHPDEATLRKKLSFALEITDVAILVVILCWK